MKGNKFAVGGRIKLIGWGIIFWAGIILFEGRLNHCWAGDNEPYALKFLPHNRKGEVDWVAAVSQGLINPVGTLDPEKSELPPLKLDVLIKARSEKGVLFSHESHTYWLACDGCHPSIFVDKKGNNGISMRKIMRGEFCGECHGKVAFSIYNCETCHKEEKDITTKWGKK